MKKFSIIFMIMIMTAVLISCESSSDTEESSGYIPVKVTIDGREYTYFTDGFSNESPGYDILLMKNPDNDNGSDEIYFILKDNGSGMIKDFTGGTEDLDYFSYCDHYNSFYGGSYVGGNLTGEINVTVTSWSTDKATMSFNGTLHNASYTATVSSESFTIPFVNYRK